MSNEPAMQSSNNVTGGNAPQSGSENVGGDKIIVGNISNSIVATGRDAQVYQTIVQPLPVDLRNLALPLIEHYTTAVFGGRDAELAALDAFLADPNHPFGLLVAPTGLGKTALLVRWIARVQQQQTQWRIIFVPISIRYQTASEQTALSLLAWGLADLHHDLERFRTLKHSPDDLRSAIIRYLRRPPPRGVQALIVIDGIDEAIGWKVCPLCAAPPQTGLKIVVSARQLANATRDDWQRCLGWNAAAVQHLDLRALDQYAIAALLRQSGPALDPRAADPDFVAQFHRVSEGDPLTANLLIQALTSGQITPESLTRRPPGLEAFLKDWVEKLRQRRQASRAIRELLALCAAAYGPLTADDLQALAPEVFGEQSDIVDAVSDDQVARFIIAVGEHTYVFSHQRLREVFLEQIYPRKDRERLKQRLIDYGEAWYADRSQPLPDYIRQFWIMHLVDAGQWERVKQIVTDIVPGTSDAHLIQPWQTARHAAEGSDSGYLSDLDVLWRHAEEQVDLDLMVRCALIAASLRSRASAMFPELLAQLVKVDTPEVKWSPAAALEHVAQMPEASKQAECLQALVKHDIALPWERALEVVRSIDSDFYRSEALAALAPHLPERLLGTALELAHAIGYEHSRATALAALAPRLPETLLSKALEMVRAIEYDRDRATALAALVPRLPETLLSKALEMVRAIEYDRDRAMALAALAPQLPESSLSTALDIVRAIKDDRDRATALAALAPRLPPDNRQQVLRKELATIKTAPSFVVGDALATLASCLFSEMISEALAIAATIADTYERANALIALLRIPNLSPKDKEQALREARAAVQNIGQLTPLAAPPLRPLSYQETERTIETIQERAKIHAALAAYLSSDERRQALIQMISAIRDMTRRDSQRFSTVSDSRHSLDIRRLVETLIEALAAFAPHLSSDELAEALKIAHSIDDPEAYARTLAVFAPRFTVELAAETLEVVCALSEEYRRSKAMEVLAPYLELGLPDHARRALDAAQTMHNTINRTKALTALVPHLPPTEKQQALTEAWNAAWSIDSMLFRVDALIALVPHLSPRDRQDVLRQLLEDVRRVDDAIQCAHMLAVLLPYLQSNEQRREVLTRALECARIDSDIRRRVKILTALLPHIPRNDAGIWSEALGFAQSLSSDAESHTEALVALSPHLPENFLSEAWRSAQCIKNEHFRAKALISFIHRFSPFEQQQKIREVVNSIRSLPELYRAELLTALFPYLSPEEQRQALSDARTAPKGIFRRRKVEVQIALLPHLSPMERQHVLTDVLANVSSFESKGRDADHDRAHALIALTPYLSHDLFEETLKLAHAIEDSTYRANVLTALAPHLPESLLAAALDSARAIRGDADRTRALAELLPRLSPDKRQEVLKEEISRADAIPNKGYRACVLAPLIPYLPSSTQESALKDALRQMCNSDVADAYAEAALRVLALQLAKACAGDHALFSEMLRNLARQGRRTLLRRLAMLMPWITAFAEQSGQADVVIKLSRSVVDVSKCWP